MLPRKFLVKKTRWVWIALVALSPLAYVVGTWFVYKYDANPKAGFSVDRTGAIDKARNFVASKGMDVNGWDTLSILNPPNENLYFYYPLHSGRDVEIACRLAPTLNIGVIFRAPDKAENIEVLLDKKGEILGFKRNISNFQEVKDPGEPAQRKLAEEALLARVKSFELIETPVMKLQETSQDGIITRKYTWKWPLPSLDGLSIESVLSTRGEMLTSDLIEANFDKGYPQKMLRSDDRLKTGSIILYSLVLTIVLIFGVYRFVQRVKEKELSFSRITVLTVLFAAMLSIFILTSDVAIYQIARIPDFPAPDVAILFSASMFYVAISLFFGLAYGAGEGDIRESYPGKLTSLDAFITGRFISKNVAVAVVIGVAIGGWVVLTTTVPDLIWHGEPASGKGYSGLEAWFGYFPLLSPFLFWPMDTMLICVMGLLLPLPFLRRRFASHRAIIPILMIFTWIAAAGPYMNFRPWGGILIEGFIRGAFFLLAFFAFDLLTAIFTLASASTFIFGISLAAQPAPVFHTAGVSTIVIQGIGLVVAIIFAFKGRFYRDEEVRPVYARHLAERISMQAEVSAARQAQMRLMPESLPLMNSFSIAAKCAPAFEVGGDFYDLFELEQAKLGILIAEGGGTGLGSALSVAFAKGFLMPRILSNGSRTDDSPTEIIRSLQDRLMSMLNDEAGVGLAYAVMDADDGLLRYARIGDYPAIMVFRGDKNPQPVPVEERDLKFISNRIAGANVRVIEGLVQLEDGDFIMCYTDGIDKSWKKAGTTPTAEFAKILDSITTRKIDLQESLDKSIKDAAKRAKKQGIEDDLTAVIIKVDSRAGKEQAVVRKH